MARDCLDHGKERSLTPEGYALVSKPGVRSRCVRHTCDNPRCINPEHLLLGTWADNNRDRAERVRSAKKVPTRHKLTKQQALVIQSRYTPHRCRVNGVSALAREFCVDTNVIYRVVKGVHACLE